MTHDELDEALADIAEIERRLARQRLARDRELAERSTITCHEVDQLYRVGRLPTLSVRCRAA